MEVVVVLALSQTTELGRADKSCSCLQEATRQARERQLSPTAAFGDFKCPSMLTEGARWSWRTGVTLLRVCPPLVLRSLVPFGARAAPKLDGDMFVPPSWEGTGAFPAFWGTPPLTLIGALSPYSRPARTRNLLCRRQKEALGWLSLDLGTWPRSSVCGAAAGGRWATSPGPSAPIGAA